MRTGPISQTSSPALAVRGLGVRYGRIAALTGVDLDVEAGSVLGIIGPNGSGKSTLLKAVAGLIVPATGTVAIFGRPPAAQPRGTIGYVPQLDDVDWTFPATVRDVVAMARYPRLGPFAPFGAADRAAVEGALEAMDLQALARRPIAQLSGGQQQRAFVARAIAQEPAILLLDEPTTGVDAATSEALRRVVRRLAAAGLPVLMTTHDLERAPEWFDRMVVVDRRVVAAGTPEEILAGTHRSSHHDGCEQRGTREDLHPSY